LKIAADLAARGLPDALITAAVEASRDGETETACARRALERAGQPRGARAWRFLAARGFPEEAIADVIGEVG
jgi:SOS response regulatory protein OraA/RecX